MGVIKKLIFFYVLFVIVKSILSYFIASPTMFADELAYFKMAQSFFNNFTFERLGGFTGHYPPLYPILISIAFIFKDSYINYIFAKLINVIISSLVIFPAYFLSREFFTKKKSLWVAILISIIPINFVYSPYILSENLFFPLFLFCVYFAYKSFTNLEYKWDILTGIFLGLCYLTRFIAISLIPMILFLLIYKMCKREFIQIKKKLILFLISFLIVLPWLIRNVYQFGFGLRKITGYTSELIGMEKYFSIISFLYYPFLYFTYTLLACGIIFFILSFLVKNGKKIFIFKLISFSSFIILMLMASGHNSLVFWDSGSWLQGKLMGRYIASIFPLFIILGFIGIKKNILEKVSFKKIWWIGLIFGVISLIGFKLNSYSLFPINNISLSWLGAFNYILDYLSINKLITSSILIFFLPLMILSIYKKYFNNFKKIFTISLIVFSMMSLVAYGINYLNAQEWNELDQMKLGKLINKEQIEGSLLFDFDFNATINKDADAKKEVYLGSFWIKNQVSRSRDFRNKDFDYFITTNTLDLPVDKKVGNVYMYKTK